MASEGPPDAAVLAVLEWLVRSADAERASVRSILEELSAKFGGHDFTDRKPWIKENIVRLMSERPSAGPISSAAVATSEPDDERGGGGADTGSDHGGDDEDDKSAGRRQQQRQRAKRPEAALDGRITSTSRSPAKRGRVSSKSAPAATLSASGFLQRGAAVAANRKFGGSRRGGDGDAHDSGGAPTSNRTVEVPLRFSGLMEPLILSPELSAVCGDEPTLPRPWIVKRLAAYVREHGLKDPNDGRRVLCDERLKRVFNNASSVTMFGMNKEIGRHARGANRCDEAERARLDAWRREWEAKGLTARRQVKRSASVAPRKQSSPGGSSEDDHEGDDNDEDSHSGGAATPSSRGSCSQQSPSSPPPSMSQSPRGRVPQPEAAADGVVRGGLATPMRLSPALSRVCGGKRQLGRTHIVQAIWAYIRAHRLQDPHDKRTILCDDALKAVFDNESRVTAFSMNKYLSRHMSSAADHDRDGDCE